MCQTKMGAQQHENPFSPSLVRSMLNRTASEITCPISASASFASQAPTSWDPSTSYLPKTVFALSRNSCGDIAQEERPQKRGKGAKTIETSEWMRPSTWLLSAFVFFCSIPGLRVPQARGRARRGASATFSQRPWDQVPGVTGTQSQGQCTVTDDC